MAKELEDLETSLRPQLQVTIQAAQQITPDQQDLLAKWLARLKNAYFDAEAILHDLEYDRLKRKVTGEDKKLLVRLSSQSLIQPVIKKLSLLSPQQKKLLHRLNKLKKVAAEAKTFPDLPNKQKVESLQNAGNSHFVTSSLLGKDDELFGRDEYRDDIINFMLDKQGDCYSVVDILVRNFTLLTEKLFGRHRDRDENRYSVVAITGMGGIGKTALARCVFNDDRIKKHFGVIMWLDFSQNLDIIERTKEMIGCVLPSKKKYHNQRNLSVLQNELIKILPQSGKIMVVLDNVWYDNNDRVAEDNQWENLLKPFTNFVSQGGACKIVVTSRSSWKFPIKLLPGKHIKLSDLAPRDFKSLLRYHAIDGLQNNNPQLKNDDLSDMSCIVDQIAKKMIKLPLAAKLVGNELRGRPKILFWRDTLENVQCLKDTMNILLWSFYRFDVQLQRCFLFCSIFPKRTGFDLDTLVAYWVALDFIQPSKDNRSVEDIGLEYFKIMEANSIFHLVDNKYIMHDLFHELAEKLSSEDCFRITNAETEIPSTVQHVYLEGPNDENLKKILSSICKLRNLRTLILGNPFIKDIREIIPKEAKIFFRNLRVLDIWSRGYKIVPEVVGGFRNLRLLNFGMSSIEQLPNSVCKLYHLQFLELPSSVETLPTELCNLIKLRHIEMFNSDGQCVYTLPRVPYLGKLTSLQSLNEFHVRNKNGYHLQQLGHLKEIGGSLRIVNLQNVRDENEAVEAKLIDKPKLKKLELVWTGSAEINDLQKEVIEALQPPTNLESLTIDGYRGSTYPTWLHEDSFVKNIKDVRFYDCNALTNLPRNFDQFCRCSELVLQNLGVLRELSTFPENLARLSIIKCPNLIFVCENELQVNKSQSNLQQDELQLDKIESIFQQFLGGGVDLKRFRGKSATWGKSAPRGISPARRNAPKLSRNENLNKKIKINKLKLPSKLRILDLGYFGVSDGALSGCLSGMTTLEELYLSDISTITTLPPEQVLESLKSLQVVQIKNCGYLRSLGGLHALPYLKHFLVEGTLYLEMQSTGTSRRLPPTLQSFTIESCGDPQVFLNDHLPCLQIVKISNCQIVSRFLSFRQLTNLKSLVILNCHNLFSIQGLESHPFISTLHLVGLPNLTVQSVRESWQGCRHQLIISNSVMLNNLLSSHDFAPQFLGIENCQEETIPIEKSDHLQSIKTLVFSNCKTKNLPKTLSDFSTLEFIDFIDCPQISELSQLPGSIQRITIRGCPELQKRCQPKKGRDWHKIKHIQDRWIE